MTLDHELRVWLFQRTADTGDVPDAATIAHALGEPVPVIEQALERLAAGRVLVLVPGTHQIWMAAPFSAVPTPFVVRARGRRYFGNCIWDALGIAALLDCDAVVDASCGDCGEAMPLAVRDRAVAGDGVVHFAVPAARWWEDIGFT